MFNRFGNGGICSRCGRRRRNGRTFPRTGAAEGGTAAAAAAAAARGGCGNGSAAALAAGAARGGFGDGSAAAAAAAAGAAGGGFGNNGTCSLPTPARELYGIRTTVQNLRTCCDPYFGCRQYPAEARNSFWPGFAHPRWLNCDELYDRRRNDRLQEP